MNLQDRLRTATRALLVDLDAAGARLDQLPQAELKDALNRYLERVLDAAGHADAQRLPTPTESSNEPTTPQGRPWEPSYA